jgi:predicted permease
MLLNSIFPVFALIVLGAILKRLNLTGEAFLKTSDRLVYFIFFPAMLFWKIGGSSMAASVNWNLCKAAACAVLTLYLLSCLGIRGFNIPDFQAGTFSQSCYRFNTYIGMAVVLNAIGDQGIRQFGILIGVVIPIINVLAISTLIWFSGIRISFGNNIRMSARAIGSNPLIIACVAGIVYARFFNTFPEFVDKTLQLASFVTLPLALLSIGATLTFKNIRGYLKLSLIASVYKLFMLPITGYFFLGVFGVHGMEFKTGMIFFALPTSTAIYILSSQLNSDTNLASAAIVISTLMSFVSLSVVLMCFVS